ncbi:MAG: phosphoglucomutase/phosphomannomutase family protein [Chloroherpetonaceae bacterium]|nr:phosphoglucomutase/phosphomannomutase family protein [Chloroherpetonaceae bacterium]MDW8437115.1 phosphoglucomutase/phosphomannomutase family protein [Chloroherpetonaceae bacterium]
MKIKFGTSGWRAIIADEFTFENLTLVLKAILRYLREENLKSLVIGRDTRFLGEEFSKLAAQFFATNGVQAFLCERDAPTPVISYEIRRRKAGGGVNFTASHNPPEYQGLKFSTADGAPALPEITKKFERYFEEFYAEHRRDPKPETLEPFENLVAEKKIEIIDPSEPYLKRVAEIVDADVIAKSGVKIVYDAMHGTARGYTDKFLRDLGVEVETLHGWRDVYFGGRAPEPSQERIPELIERVKERGAKGEFVMGIANDGDADRYAVVDSTGAYLQANQLLAILFHYALKNKPDWKGCVVRTLATTHLIDAIAKRENVKLYDVPVGFKYIGEIMMREDMIVGGEESNGLSVYRHIPEKDGVLACLLFVEIAARTKEPLSRYLQRLYDEYGYFCSTRENLRLSEEKKNALLSKLQNDTPKSVAGRAVARVDKRDGVKMICDDGSWLLVRFSGTEPVVRFYAESSSEKQTAEMIAIAKSWI